MKKDTKLLWGLAIVFSIVMTLLMILNVGENYELLIGNLYVMITIMIILFKERSKHKAFYLKFFLISVFCLLFLISSMLQTKPYLISGVLLCSSLLILLIGKK